LGEALDNGEAKSGAFDMAGSSRAEEWFKNERLLVGGNAGTFVCNAD
jgi:hypothetical protein